MDFPASLANSMTRVVLYMYATAGCVWLCCGGWAEFVRPDVRFVPASEISSNARETLIDTISIAWWTRSLIRPGSKGA